MNTFAHSSLVYHPGQRIVSIAHAVHQIDLWLLLLLLLLRRPRDYPRPNILLLLLPPTRSHLAQYLQAVFPVSHVAANKRRSESRTSTQSFLPASSSTATSRRRVTHPSQKTNSPRVPHSTHVRPGAFFGFDYSPRLVSFVVRIVTRDMPDGVWAWGALYEAGGIG